MPRNHELPPQRGQAEVYMRRHVDVEPSLRREEANLTILILPKARCDPANTQGDRKRSERTEAKTFKKALHSLILQSAKRIRLNGFCGLRGRTEYF